MIAEKSSEKKAQMRPEMDIGQKITIINQSKVKHMIRSEYVGFQ